MAREPQIRRKTVRQIQDQADRITRRMFERGNSLDDVRRMLAVADRYIDNAYESQSMRNEFNRLRNEVGLSPVAADNLMDLVPIRRSEYMGRRRRRR